jgi:hypothetical protein
MANRAANGRSSIYLGADGRWHGRVSMAPTRPPASRSDDR